MKKTLLSVALILALSLGGAVAMALESTQRAKMAEKFAEIVELGDGGDMFLYFSEFVAEFGAATSVDFAAISDEIVEVALSADVLSKDLNQIYMFVENEKDWTLSLATFGVLFEGEALSGDLTIVLDIAGFENMPRRDYNNYEGWADLFADNVLSADRAIIGLGTHLNMLLSVASGDIPLTDNDVKDVEFGIYSSMAEEGYPANLNYFFANLEEIAEGNSSIEDKKVIDWVYVVDECYLNITDSLLALVVDEDYDHEDVDEVYFVLFEQNKKAVLRNSTDDPVAVIRIKAGEELDFDDEDTYDIIIIGAGDRHEEKGSSSGGGCSATGFAPLAVLALLGMAIGKRK